MSYLNRVFRRKKASKPLNDHAAMQIIRTALTECAANIGVARIAARKVVVFDPQSTEKLAETLDCLKHADVCVDVARRAAKDVAKE